MLAEIHHYNLRLFFLGRALQALLGDCESSLSFPFSRPVNVMKIAMANQNRGHPGMLEQYHVFCKGTPILSFTHTNKCNPAGCYRKSKFPQEYRDIALWVNKAHCLHGEKNRAHTHWNKICNLRLGIRSPGCSSSHHNTPCNSNKKHEGDWYGKNVGTNNLFL